MKEIDHQKSEKIKNNNNISYLGEKDSEKSSNQDDLKILDKNSKTN